MDNVQYVSLGVLFSGALTKDGELYIWGNNSLGCVGIESDDYYIPVPTKIDIR